MSTSTALTVRHSDPSTPGTGRQRFESLFEAQVLLEDFRIDYNKNRAHSTHGWRSPAEFVEEWLTKQTALTSSVAQLSGNSHDCVGAHYCRVCSPS